MIKRPILNLWGKSVNTNISPQEISPEFYDDDVYVCKGK